ncbi:helix-turn-helix domain-containing protein [Planktothrix paucivesiculata]|uniref:HTH cro/C1-type domain-containing protein n=1 Tax=Planktothrix paucivesiculata PCC 9631 TaxID=671071 RepID=A0A7Z9E4L5_9CYAN|nr:helix-turn-helix transcriptional regulator [Planktothrix paucivesiculata]VXD25201.1 conserved hypothetical protein [Planktothrix paucivesiculata PCC 9631]
MLLETTPKEKLASLVREMRGDKSQRSFAKLLGVSYYAVQTWEKQSVWPDDDNLEKLANLKGWTKEQLQLYLHIPQLAPSTSLNNSFMGQGQARNVEPTDSTQPLGLSVADLLAEVRALPFEAAVQVAQVALQTIEAKGSWVSSEH